MKNKSKTGQRLKSISSFIVLAAVFYFASSAYAMDFNCTAPSGLRSDPQDHVNVRGSFDSDGTLKNINLSLLDKTDPTEHTLIDAAGPITAEARFHPTANRLKNFDKYVLSKQNGDSFQFFVPHATTSSLTRAFIRIAFEDTKPDLEELECTATP